MFDPSAIPTPSALPTSSVSPGELLALANLLKIVIGTMVASIVAIVGFTWKAGRNKQLEETKIENGDKAFKMLVGDPEAGKNGLSRRVDEVENVLEGITDRLKVVTDVTSTHSSNPQLAKLHFDHHVEEITKRTIEAEKKRIEEARRAIIEEQNQRFETGSHRALVNEEPPQPPPLPPRKR